MVFHICAHTHTHNTHTHTGKNMTIHYRYNNTPNHVHVYMYDGNPDDGNYVDPKTHVRQSLDAPHARTEVWDCDYKTDDLLTLQFDSGLQIGSNRLRLVSNGLSSIGAGQRRVSDQNAGSQTIFRTCFNVYWVIDVCVNFGAFWEAYSSSSQTNLQFEVHPSVRAGLSVSASVNIRVAEAGVYAQGNLIDTSFPLSVGMDTDAAGLVTKMAKGEDLDFCLNWQGQQRPFSLTYGLYYRVIQCRFGFIYCRCSMSGRRNIGTPGRWGSGSASFDIVTVCL